MNDRDAFLSAVLARPEDDLPRMIYADYLDEQGDEDAPAWRAPWEKRGVNRNGVTEWRVYLNGLCASEERRRRMARSWGHVLQWGWEGSLGTTRFHAAGTVNGKPFLWFPARRVRLRLMDFHTPGGTRTAPTIDAARFLFDEYPGQQQDACRLVESLDARGFGGLLGDFVRYSLDLPDDPRRKVPERRLAGGWRRQGLTG